MLYIYIYIFIDEIQSLYIEFAYKVYLQSCLTLLLYFETSIMNHEILRTVFLPNTANDFFFLCQETCVYAKITALMCLKIDSGQVQK